MSGGSVSGGSVVGGVGDGVGAGVGRSVEKMTVRQQLVSAGYAPQPTAPSLPDTALAHLAVFLQVPVPCGAEHDFTAQH